MDNFLNELLCGFRESHSTQHVLFKLEQDISGFIRTILRDLSKAYYSLPYDLLITKLGAEGLERSSLILLMDYLNSRKQQTKVRSSYNNWSEIKHRILQVSIVGHLLFNIFTNKLFFDKLKSDACNFADDHTLHSCRVNLKTVLENLKHDASKLLYWFKINSMKEIPEKFQFMILSKNLIKLKNVL